MLSPSFFLWHGAADPINRCIVVMLYIHEIYAVLRKRINVCLQSAPLACRRFKLKSTCDGRER